MQSSAYEDMYYEQGSNSTHVMPELAFHGDDDMANELGATLLIGSCPKLGSSSSTGCDNNNRGGLLIPKGGTSVGKPTRRRSRSSKKLSPTTLLNANPNNFRSLVQQFTGCHTTPPGNTTAYRGPITLNFSQHKYRRSQNLDHYQSSDQIQQQWSTAMASSDHEQVDQSFFSFTATNSIASTTNNSNVTTTDLAHDHQLFRVPAVNYYEPPPRPDPLTVDDFDLESLSPQQLSAPEDDYSAGTRNDDDHPVFWGF